jgi:conjugal transfer pilus assembly protein TraV
MMMKPFHLIIVLLGVLLLSGCSTSPNYACGTPQGGKCQSVSDSYLSALGKKLKGNAGNAAVTKTANTTTGKPAVEASARVTQYIPEGVAIRSLPQVMRVWIAPWEDNNGVFHDQSYSYFVADAGEWSLRANTEKSLYPNGYALLARPTDKTAAPADNKADAKPKAAMTTQQAQDQALDFMAGE